MTIKEFIVNELVDRGAKLADAELYVEESFEMVSSTCFEGLDKGEGSEYFANVAEVWDDFMLWKEGGA